MRDHADDASDAYRHRKNDATNKLARSLYLASAVLLVVEIIGMLFSAI